MGPCPAAAQGPGCSCSRSAAALTEREWGGRVRCFRAAQPWAKRHGITRAGLVISVLNSP